MPTKLSTDEMKDFVRAHFEEFVNKRNAAVIRRNMTPDFYDHNGPRNEPTDVNGDEEMMLSMYKAMPDLKITIEDMIAEGEDAFPGISVLSTANVAEDIASDGPWIIRILQQKLGKDGPGGFLVPEVMTTGSLILEGKELEVMEYSECESKHIATLHIPSLKAHLTSDIIYRNAHCYLQERHLESWLKRLDDLEQFVTGRVTTLYPGHGEPGSPAELIAETRAYLRDFAAALPGGSAHSLEQTMLAKYPAHHAKQFLTVFSVPAYFARKTPT